MQYVTVDDRLASILVQRATGHENLEAYGTSPIIHSVFHDSVENQALKMQQGSCLVRFFVEHAVKISVEVQEKISGAAAAENNASAFHVHPASPSGPVSNSFPLKLFQLNHGNAIFIDHNCDGSHARTSHSDRQFGAAIHLTRAVAVMRTNC